MMELIAPHAEANLKAGFRKCSIFPLNIEQVLSRIPRNICDPDLVHSEFIKTLEAKRSEVTSIVKNRRKKMNVPAGKSVCTDEPTFNEGMDTEDEVVPRDEPCTFSRDEPHTSLRQENDIIFDDNSSDDVDFQELAKEQEKENQFVNFLEGKISHISKMWSGR